MERTAIVCAALQQLTVAALTNRERVQYKPTERGGGGGGGGWGYGTNLGSKAELEVQKEWYTEWSHYQ